MIQAKILAPCSEHILCLADLFLCSMVSGNIAEGDEISRNLLQHHVRATAVNSHNGIAVSINDGIGIAPVAVERLVVSDKQTLVSGLICGDSGRLILVANIA